MSAERCETCRYWALAGHPNDIPKRGCCHRYPRVVVATEDRWDFRFTPMFSNDWCGEHKPREDKPHWLEREP